MLPDTSPETPEFPPPLEDFRPWFAEVVSAVRPDLVVCIARSALRLMQLHKIGDLLHGVPVVTQFTLPLLEDHDLRGRRVMIFDDSVVFGSTLGGTYKYLIARGADPTCATYIADKEVFFGESPGGKPSPYAGLPLLVRHRLPGAQVMQHHDTVIQAILRTALEYNPEFSSSTLETSTSEKSFAAFLVPALGRHPAIRRVVEVTSATSANAGVYRFSILAGYLPSVFESRSLRLIPSSKFRACWESATQRLKLTAVPQVSMSDVDPAGFEFTDPIVQAHWQRLRYARRPEDALWPQAIFRLVTAVASTALNAGLAKDLPRLLSRFTRVRPAEFVSTDLSTVLASHNAGVLSDLFYELASSGRSLEGARQLSESSMSGVNGAQTYGSEEDLSHALLSFWRETPAMAPAAGESAYEALGKTFIALHEVTDSAALRFANPGAGRINVGLSLSTIDRLLRRTGIAYDLDDLSTALDVAVDQGQAVPRVLCDGGGWYRAFYSGENRNPIDPLQLKGLIHRSYSAHIAERRSRERLSPFLFNKLFATLKDILPRLPISTRFTTFGKVAMVNADDMVPWLTASIGSPLRLVRQQGRDALEPNELYRPSVDPAWSAQETRDFADGFSFIATAFEAASPEEILLLSTCRTHRHLYCSIAVEAHQWIADVKGFGAFLEDLAAAESASAPPADALHHLYYCCRYVAETSKKHALFTSNFEKLRKTLVGRFRSQGAAAMRFWEYFVDGPALLDKSIVPELDARMSVLMPLVSQMRHLTAFAVRALSELDPNYEASLRDVFARSGASLEWRDFRWVLRGTAAEAASRYNRDRESAVAGRSLLTRSLPETSRSSTPEIGSAMRDCYQDLRSAVLLLCPRYLVEEGNEFEFAPDQSKRLLPDGSIEEYLSGQFVLALDVIGSTDSAAGAQLKTSVLGILDSRSSDRLRFATAGDDKFVVCHHSPVVLWDVAVAIMLDGGMLASGAMRGTRKGLGFGAVTLHTKPDGRCFVYDTVSPHVIPQAVGTIEGVRQSETAAECGHNEVLSIDMYAAGQAAGLLHLDLAKAEKVDVSAKHYRSACYVVKLIDRE